MIDYTRICNNIATEAGQLCSYVDEVGYALESDGKENIFGFLGRKLKELWMRLYNAVRTFWMTHFRKKTANSYIHTEAVRYVSSLLGEFSRCTQKVLQAETNPSEQTLHAAETAAEDFESTVEAVQKKVYQCLIKKNDFSAYSNKSTIPEFEKLCDMFSMLAKGGDEIATLQNSPHVDNVEKRLSSITQRIVTVTPKILKIASSCKWENRESALSTNVADATTTIK